jgi:glucosamine--fructose-6-phosphate aminotransferase (isomerizing)
LSDPKDNRAGGATTSGAYALAEILSQPKTWDACFELLAKERRLEAVKQRFQDKRDWVFVGCGSSYYVALAAAASMSSLTDRRARAVPASEVLLYPELTLGEDKDMVPVLISRSGKTSEVLQAAQVFKDRGIDTLAISCSTGQPLEQMASTTLLLSPADEQSTVMTRSFTSMLLALQALAATLAGNKSFLDALRQLPSVVERTLHDVPKRVREFVAGNAFADYVSLAQGPFYGLACESALKMTEMSVSYGQVFHTLEFRHGPKSIVGPETLLVFLLSEASYSAECEVLEEMKQLGGTTLVVCNRAERRARAAADLLIELGLDSPELARLAPYLFATQLTGLYTGLKKGLDPDHPRNLSRVVELEAKGSETTEHAAF